MDSHDLHELLSSIETNPPDLKKALLGLLRSWSLKDSFPSRIKALAAGIIISNAPGFRNGWVSSAQLKKRLLEQGVSLSPNQCHALMLSFGYYPHPCLDKGRTTYGVLPDKGATVVFVLFEHYSLSLSDPAEITRAYRHDQGDLP